MPDYQIGAVQALGRANRRKPADWRQKRQINPRSLRQTLPQA
jgi:hypothetical protein